MLSFLTVCFVIKSQSLKEILMPLNTNMNATVHEFFYEPLQTALVGATNGRKCHGLSDDDFLEAGVGRCTDDSKSGRAWIQKIQSMMMAITVGGFFDSLKSGRRLKLVKEVAHLVRGRLDNEAPLHDDPFASHSEMSNFAVYAADGHYHGASSHENLIEGERQAVGHLFAMNLRTQSMHHLSSVPIKTKKSEHEISTLKKMDADAIRMGEPTKRQLILAYDPAIYNFDQWHRWKQAKGVYIVTLAKKDTALLFCGENEIDHTDSRNAGVQSDKIGGATTGHMLRRIVYIDPVTGVEYIFLTNQMTLPPGLIAFIYKKRWDIEKAFDGFKNKLDEKKAWANSDTAKCAQAKFMALTHNLILLLERKIEADEGITDTKIEKKRQIRLKQDLEAIRVSGRKVNPLVTRGYKPIQRSLQFIRWLRSALLQRASWRPSMAILAPLMAGYLR